MNAELVDGPLVVVGEKLWEVGGKQWLDGEPLLVADDR